MDHMNLTDRTILITGGSSGIGLALAVALLACRCTVLVTGRSRARLDAARAAHPGLVTLVRDVTHDDDLDALVETVRREHPGLSVLVNNAGVMRSWSVADEPWSGALDEEIATNLVAPMKLTSRLLPTLLAQPSAAVVNVSSALAYAPISAIPLYCATKAALHSFSKSLRHQLRGRSVSVFELLPSTVATAMSKSRFSSSMVTPEQVVAALLRGVARDRPEIRVGQATALYVITRLLPSVIERSLLATPTAKDAHALPSPGPS
jgi:uncharacterized oxidoreductase